MIELCHVTKTFHTDTAEVEAVRDVSLTIEKGDIFGIIGLSGAGKSTLVRCINFLEVPTSGEVKFKGTSRSSLTKKELLETRRSISMIFQGFNLLSQRTALKNVCYPLEIAGIPKKEAEKKARDLLAKVGLSDKADEYPCNLSGGQCQRVAIARALCMDPEILCFDEPTSALDPQLTQEVLTVIRQLAAEKRTMIVVTHEMNFARDCADRVIYMENGRVVEDGPAKEVLGANRSEAIRAFAGEAEY